MNRSGGPGGRYLVALVVTVAMIVMVAVASRSDRPALVGDGVSFTAVGVLGMGLAFVLVAALLVIATSLRRRVMPKQGGVDGRRVAAVGLLLLAVAVVVLPRLAGDELLEDEFGVPIMPPEGDRSAEPGQVVSSPTAVGAGILALILAAAVVVLMLRPGAGRSRRSAGPVTEVGDDPGVGEDRAVVVDPRGPPRAVVLAAYEQGRRLVVPLVGAQPTDGPLTLLRRVRRTAVAEPFDDLTRAYLPVRFGLVLADEARRDATVDALARLRRELPS